MFRCLTLSHLELLLPRDHLLTTWLALMAKVKLNLALLLNSILQSLTMATIYTRGRPRSATNVNISGSLTYLTPRVSDHQTEILRTPVSLA